MSCDLQVSFCSPAVGALHTLVANHAVRGRVIFPAAGYLEVARAAGATELRGVYFLQPLAVEAPELLVECAVLSGRFDVRSGGDGAMLEDKTVHCSGGAAMDSAGHRPNCASLRTFSHAADAGSLYDCFDKVGLCYGPGYRTLMQAWGTVSDALARLHARPTHDGTRVHPADLDDALCASAVIASSNGIDGGETRLPFALDDAVLQGIQDEPWTVCSLPLTLSASFPRRPFLSVLGFTGCGEARY